MNILFIGDIFGAPGRRIVADHLQDIIQTNRIDLAIANAENAAGGFGITPSIAEDLFGLGLDVLTSGNHIWDKRDLYDYLGRQPRLLRPANYPEGPGRGVVVYRARNGMDCAVLNLQGRTYMPVPGWPRFGHDRYPHARAHRGHPYSSGWDRVPDGLRDDRAVPLGDRGSVRDSDPEVPYRIAGADGGGAGRAGTARRDHRCGRGHRQGALGAAPRDQRRLRG